MTFRRGVRLALDLGQARIGVAACDPDAILAHPVRTVRAGGGKFGPDDPALDELLEIVEEYQPREVVIGLATSLSGQDGPAARRIRQRARRFAAAVAEDGITVRLVDERFTTTSAARQLQQAGRRSHQQRSVIDQAAAVAILEHALETERRTGEPPGEPVEP
ncbi:MAG TPA: Holliday junction resolvase RuvX [Candidatus Avipropionibacterium avicola]|uniref:Putative pre-16S rRNA nuclease n=1 Tax=Candidatus Avipropionibacterium avicola TaxID=2840701 RepID=A0A9D1GXQ3_9ACTN|nr:Holliday junction resolvase RuvX [Candidatus Avipropionibacterium avicola]